MARKRGELCGAGRMKGWFPSGTLPPCLVKSKRDGDADTTVPPMWTFGDTVFDEFTTRAAFRREGKKPWTGIWENERIDTTTWADSFMVSLFKADESNIEWWWEAAEGDGALWLMVMLMFWIWILDLLLFPAKSMPRVKFYSTKMARFWLCVTRVTSPIFMGHPSPSIHDVGGVRLIGYPLLLQLNPATNYCNSGLLFCTKWLHWSYHWAYFNSSNESPSIWSRHMRAYIPRSAPSAINSSWVPCSMSFPLSRTKIMSARRAVLRRCAINSVVLPLQTAAAVWGVNMFRWISRSVPLSRADVASSSRISYEEMMQPCVRTS